MSKLADEARDFADRVLGSVPSLIDKRIEERRSSACWYEHRARYMLAHCNPVMRPWWRLWVRRHAAACAANRDLATQCAKAATVVRHEGIV